MFKENTIVNGGLALGYGEPSEDGLLLRHHFMSVNNKRLCICSWGNVGDPLIVLLHGLQSHAGLWEQVAIELSNQGYWVVAPDRRGHGYSDWFESYNSMDYVSDLHRIITGLTKQPVILVGHCESTILCSFYASSFPETVNSLILLQFPDLSRVVTAKTKADLVNLFLQKEAVAQEKPPQYFANTQEATKRLLSDAPFKIPELMAQKVTPRNTIAFNGGVRWRWDPRILNYRLMYDILDADVLANAMKKIKVKTTFVYGEMSSLMIQGKNKLLDFSHKMMPDAAQVLVSGGHYPHMEQESYRDFAELLMTS
ncbi:alpha/beta fold hydrolase [Aliikangiella sp. IMCC44359]|uniref:alpha/beta fold hydrolase n=1 Tax=Aliikangiella sp. IMCC44359 TaxID=3459125 RepID=UPI00403ACE65